MAWTRVVVPELPDFPAFGHAAVAGDTVYVSGMLGLADDGRGVVPGGIAAETRQSFKHVEHILRGAGATLADIVKVSVYMTDLGEWEAMNAAYLDIFGDRTPARIAVGCADLLFAAKVEFDCVAFTG